jgi:7-keto-8-aminopelargonate synthetase-like enzyme
MDDLFSKFDPLIAQREALLSTGITDPFNLVMERVESPTVAICNGKRTILLGTYNYMGMTFDPDVIAAGKQALDEYGSGTTGSRVLNGTYRGHRDCEEALKEFYAMDHAMVFSTGYQANLGIISTIAGKDDYIILDIDSHASIYDGCALGNANIVPFRHNDIDAMEKRLKRLPEGAKSLVILEGVYSMLGDIAPLKEMVAVAKAHGAMVLVDEAHSMGFIGTHGRGVAEAQGVIDDVDFIIGTFSKSVGTVGGFCVSNHPKFEILRLVCRPYVFTASLPPSVVATAATSIRKLMSEAHAFAREFEATAWRAQGTRFQAGHRGATVGDHRGDHARPGEGRGDVGGAASRGVVRQSRPPAGDARQHDAAALLAMRRAQRRAGRADPRHVRRRRARDGLHRSSGELTLSFRCRSG